MITPRDFVDRWSQSKLRETQASQSHFNELCELVGHKTPVQLDPEGKLFTFEENVEKATGGRGRADVWYKGHFAWEYKGKHRDLDEAYSQLLAYRGGLDNPPLLVVCDFLEYRIYPQWPNTSGLPFVFHNEDLLREETRDYIRYLLTDPDAFLRLRQADLEQRERLTLQLAERFAHLADMMRNYTPPPDPLPIRSTNGEGEKRWQPMQIARFLTKLVFCLFAEDVELLPKPYDHTVFRLLTDGAKSDPEGFVLELPLLFQAMNGDRPVFASLFMPYFNGGLFAESKPGANDGYEVLDLTQIPGAIDLLGEVSEKDWRFVNPTIFGTLFEGALDESKRAQLGAHYTGEADIRLVVEPVLMQPLYREWEAAQTEAQPLMQAFLNADTAPRPREDARTRLIAIHDRTMNRLETTRVLDPACGSGNFLYMSLRAMKDLEARIRKFFEQLNLPFRDVVTPRQLYGIEKDEFAANLAKVVVWIGYLQWRYEDEGGVLHPYRPRASVQHPRVLPHPIIKDKNSPDEPDRIINDDAIMRYDAEGKPYEPEWPEVDVIMGNPPFLGGKRLRTEIGDTYIDDLFTLYDERVSREADLVTYWYEKARLAINIRKEKNQNVRVGLLATQSIRVGANRTVLDKIKETGDIFMAWSDRPWVLQGASVRISVVGFDNGSEKEYLLNGVPVTHLNSDLQNTIDATKAKVLSENVDLIFMGDTKGGAFDIPDDIAQKMLAANNSSGRDNHAVLRHWINGSDITGRSRKMWIIDFGIDMPIEEAQLYELPFQYVEEQVLPERKNNRRDAYREKWWIHVETRSGMRQAFTSLKKYIATPRVAKHRIFTWVETEVLPDSRIFAICRDDDYFFGVLHSTVHEFWSLRLASWHGVGNDPTYNAQSCFETFPFPWPPGQEDTESEAYKAISTAAKQLHEERKAWLNPPPERFIELGITAQSLRERTLTNMYNAVVGFREGQNPSPDPSPFGVPNGEREQEKTLTPSPSPSGRGGKGENGNGNGRIPKAVREFAPRLAALHDALDKMVLSAYGWEDIVTSPPGPLSASREGEQVHVLRTAEGDEELLRRLLELNLQRAGRESANP